MSHTLEEKLAYAMDQQIKAVGDQAAAEHSEDYLREHAGGLGYGGSGANRGANKIHEQSRRNADRWNEAQKRIDYWGGKIRSCQRCIEERDRVRLTRDEIVGAFLVRDSGGWHTVVRVNAATVSVETAYSWVDRIPFDKILEVRS